MAFTVPALPYGFDALEPTIDKETMQIHHDKHHQAYVDNLNKAIAGTENENKSLEELIAMQERSALRFATTVVVIGITVFFGKFYRETAVSRKEPWLQLLMMLLVLLMNLKKNLMQQGLHVSEVVGFGLVLLMASLQCAQHPIRIIR